MKRTLQKVSHLGQSCSCITCSGRIKKMQHEMPLSGASIYILTADNNEIVAASMGETLQALGGTRITSLSQATHALWVPHEGYSQEQQQQELSQSTRDLLQKCKLCHIPVVNMAWLERISGLKSFEHWSDIDPSSHIPSIVDQVSQRRDKASNLAQSIQETYNYMADNNPSLVEDEAIKRAMELSMLDWALVYRSPDQTNAARSASAATANKSPSFHEILRVNPSATRAEIKAAYRKRALETHPDKGGAAGEFELVARAYRSLLHEAGQHEEAPQPPILKSTAHWDDELRDHRGLVNELFQNHGADLEANLARQEKALEALGLIPKDAGASNLNEKNEWIRNSCFYLSLASSYLHGIGALSGCEDAEIGHKYLRDADEALIRETALDLKRVIEAAVVRAHPEWAAQGMVGEEVQAFSDFLVYVLDSPTILSDWAVAVFDTASGFVDVYKSKNYPDSDPDWARSCTITIHYSPGHYQPLLPIMEETDRPTLDDLLVTLDAAGVLYVVTVA